MNFDRRRFLSSAAVASTLSFAPWIQAQSKAGKKYRLGVIGAGGWWAMNILRVALEDGRCECVAMCDVDADELEISADEIDADTGKLPNTYNDYRDMLEQEQLDVVIISSPDHWHALQAIACLEAGAHIFVEKPTGHTIQESRAMLNAANKTGKTVQVGLHRRIGPHHVSGMKFLHDGGAGQIGMVRCFAHSPGDGPEAPTPNSEIPEGLDWDLYCGPAPLRPFNKRIHPGGFRHFLDYANGTLGDWGVHWLDQVLWWSGEKFPKSVHCSGGRPIKGEPVLNDEAQTTDAPDHQVATYEFEKFTCVWEHRRFAGNDVEKSKVGTYFYGTKGIFHMGWRDGWTFYPTTKGASPVHQDPQFDHEKDGHNVPPLWRDFIDAIEAGRQPVANAEVGHLATNMSLLGMLSWKLGRSIDWDGANERITGPGADEANQLLRRDYRGPWQYPQV